MSSGKAERKTREVVLSYLQGKNHKEVAREHDVAYTTCVDICNRYIAYVPVLKKPLPYIQQELELAVDSVQLHVYKGSVQSLESEK